MKLQRTIKNNVVVEGQGIFSGTSCRLRFCPAPEDTGIVFVSTDTITPVEIPADIEYLSQRPHRTTSLTKDNVSVETIEHVLAAVSGMDIDNIIIEVNADEIPSTDGSALPFVQALQQAGLEEQEFGQSEHGGSESSLPRRGARIEVVLRGGADNIIIGEEKRRDHR